MSPTPLGILAAAGAGAAGDFELLETQVLTSNASSVTFTGLGSYTDYKHLQIRGVVQSSRSGSNVDVVRIEMNSDATSTHRHHKLQGTGSNVLSGTDTATGTARMARISTTGGGSDTYGAFIADFLDFSDSNKNNVFRTLGGYINSGAQDVALYSGSNFVAEALTSVKFDLLTSGESFTAGSRFSLYGLKAGS